MKLNSIQNDILVPFINESLSILQDMAQLKAWAGEGFQENVWKFKFKGLAIAAKTSGIVSGTILMHHHIETASAIGNKVLEYVLGEPSNSNVMTEDLKNALAEYGNTVIGLATRKLEKSNLAICFEPPYIISTSEAMTELLLNVKEIISIPIHVDSIGRYYFNYLLHHSTEAA